MKQIVIVRHAKAVPYGYEDDFNRDLKSRGMDDASRVSRKIKNRGIVPDIMISSPALRAIKTARIFAENLDFPEKQIRENEHIYEGMTTEEFIEIVRALPEEAGTAFFFGHNPAFYYYVIHLLKEYDLDMPTCAAVGIAFHVRTWKEVQSRSGTMSFRVTPKMLK